MFGPKQNYGPQKLFGPIGPQTIFGPQKIQKNFGPRKIAVQLQKLLDQLDPEKIWILRNFWTQKNVSTQKKFGP